MTAHPNKKRKADPYQIFVRITIAVAAVALISLAVFLACNAWVDSEYRGVVESIHTQNVADEQAFNVQLAAMRESAAQVVETGGDVPVELPVWEAALDGVTWRIQDEGKAGLENTYTVTINNTTLCEGGLMLVNAWHSLPSYFSAVDLVSVGSASGWKIPVQDNTVQIFPDALGALQAMHTAANDSGMKDYIIREAFRSNDRQTELFTARMDKLSSKYSGNILIEETKKTVNYPGTSEYQTGLSFQVGLYNKEDPAVAKQNLQDTPQGQWITENCWKYGVIFRFPSADYPNSQWEDKSFKTGVSAHLDLYRYVGKPHAAAMKILGFCLEEYIEFLMKHPHITIYENGELRYEIVRINVNEQAAYDLPITSRSSSYLASIDNMGGIVVAYTYGF
jgi:zinc D-Ala-D-Ala carboxypeptidase